MNEIDALIQAFKDSRMSQEALAAASGVRQATISRTLRRKTEPDLDTIRKLSAVLLPKQSNNLGFGGVSAPAKSGGLLASPFDIDAAIGEIAKQSPAQAAELQAELLMLKAKILRKAEELQQPKQQTPKAKTA